MKVKIYTYSTIKSIRPAQGMGLYVLATETNGKEVTLTGEIYFKDDPQGAGECEKATDKVSNLIVTNNAIQRLTNKCDGLEIYTDSPWLAAAWTEGWITKWAQNGWLNSRRKPIAAADMWQKLYIKLSELKITPTIHLQEWHPWSRWFLEQEKIKEVEE